MSQDWSNMEENRILKVKWFMCLKKRCPIMSEHYVKPTYQVVHFRTEMTFGSIRKFPNKNQSFGNGFPNKKVPQPFHCLFIHLIQIIELIVNVPPLNPNFYQVFIVAVTTRSQPNVVSIKLTWVRAVVTRTSCDILS